MSNMTGGNSPLFLVKSGFSDSPAKSGFLGRKVHHWRRLSYVDMEGPRGGSLPVPIRLRHAVWHLSSYLGKRGHPTSSVAILTCFPTQHPSASCTQGPRLQRKLRFRGLLGAINMGSNGDVQGMGGWLDWAARMHLQLTSLILEFDGICYCSGCKPLTKCAGLENIDPCRPGN